MNQNPEDALKDEAQERLSKISNVDLEPRRKKEAMEARLGELKKELPNALADHALGGSKEQVNQIKNEIAQAEEFLADYPFIDQGLERRAAQAQQQSRRAAAASERRGVYEGLKMQLTENYDVGLIDQLRDYARSLGEEKDCEAFLAALEKPKAE